MRSPLLAELDADALPIAYDPAAPEAAIRTSDPRTRRALGRRLYDQQLWCWGQDVGHWSGNALVGYGMTRLRPSDPDRGSTRYSITTSSAAQIALWGFGCFVGHQELGGLFVARRDFTRRLDQAPTPPDVHHRDGLCQLPRPLSRAARARARVLAAILYQWIAGYERWIAQSLGAHWRERCVQQWDQRVVPAAAMASAWTAFAETLAERN